MVNRLILLAVVALVSVAAGLLLYSAPAETADVPRVSADYLERKLGSEGVVVVDSRTDSDWSESDLKIKGAIRGRLGEEVEWAADLPRDAEIIIYCA